MEDLVILLSDNTRIIAKYDYYDAEYDSYFDFLHYVLQRKKKKKFLFWEYDCWISICSVSKNVNSIKTLIIDLFELEIKNVKNLPIWEQKERLEYLKELHKEEGEQIWKHIGN